VQERLGCFDLAHQGHHDRPAAPGRLEHPADGLWIDDLHAQAAGALLVQPTNNPGLEIG